MRYVSWARIRTGRLLIILVAIVLYIILLVVDGLRFFPRVTPSPLDWARFGFSALIGLMFLAVGSLVWLFARDRRVALLLFCFSFTMMVVFAVETASADTNDPQLTGISSANASLTLLLFSILLLIFPKNYLTSSKQPGAVSEPPSQPGSRYYYKLLLRGYVAVLIFLSIITVLYSILDYSLSLQLPGWLIDLIHSYFVLALTGILLTIIISFRQTYSLRARQQMRFFMIGVILAFAPFFFLTLLPSLLNPLSRYMVDSQISTLTAVLLPLALGYSILRYQILVFDSYIRRAVAWIAGSVALVVLGYLVVMLSSLVLSSNTTVNIICIAIVLVVLGPCVWWLAHVITERLFFSEIQHYHRLIDKPDLLNRETFDLKEASELLTLAVVNAFETQEVCLFVLDEDTGNYHLSPGLKDDEPLEAPRRRLVQRILRVLKPLENGSSQPQQHAAHSQRIDWFDMQVPVVEKIAHAKRPLLLNEASRTDAEQPIGLARYLTTASHDGADPLIVPVQVKGKMIGILALGERGDHEQYAVPDFEVLDLIIARFAPVLETARLYEKASRHVATLNTLYSASATLKKTYQSIEEVAIAYATIAAEAVRAGAEVWLYDEANQSLQHIIHLGSGPHLIPLERLTALREDDWSTWFYEGGRTQSWQGSPADVPVCLPQTPFFPFAWIPLTKGLRHYGILVLTYARPHIFSQEERRVLEMFASQCAAVMENAQITIALRTAYERQKELDRLKDQFIMTASHELRTPLTAVQGYIELLDQYNASLSAERRASFIANAHRGIDELALMVSNIMDASLVGLDVEQVRLSEVSLSSSVQHILEIMEAITTQENREIHMDVPSNILVRADDLRLRQVLLNFVNNAIKYSPAGTRIDISADRSGEDVTLQVRDYGLGVLPADQDRLFERFVRLERDMNSPVRGAGLGLYISKRLVEAMGGRIWVESSGKPGEGSIFAFTLKCLKVDTPAGEDKPAHQEV